MASKSKSRRRVFRASCILAALIVAGSSFAWFTSKDEVTNRLSANADYDVRIVESFAPPKNFLPNQEVNKDVYATNTGTVGAFVKEEVSGVMTIVQEKAQDTFDPNCTKLTEAQRYVMEAGAFLAYKPTGSAKVLGQEVIDMTPHATDPNGYTEGATDFTPDAEGLYVFRRSIDVDGARGETFEYEGYYFSNGDYYKITDLQVTPDSTPDLANDGVNTDGNLSDATCKWVKDEQTVVDPVSLEYNADTNTLVATYDTGVTPKNSLTALSKAYDDAIKEYQKANEAYNRAVADLGDGSSGTSAILATKKADLDAKYTAWQAALGSQRTAQNNYNDAVAAKAAADEKKASAQAAVDASKTRLYGAADGTEGTATSDSLKGKYNKATTDKNNAESNARTQFEADFATWAASHQNAKGNSNLSDYTYEEFSAFPASGIAYNYYELVAAEKLAKEAYEAELTNLIGGTDPAGTPTSGSLQGKLSAAEGEASTAASNVSTMNGALATANDNVTSTESAYNAALNEYNAALAANNQNTQDVANANAAKAAAQAKMNAAETAYNNAVANNVGAGSSLMKINIKLSDDVVTTADGSNNKWQIKPTTVANDTAEFYYTGILDGGETSSKLVDSITLDKSVTQDMYKSFDFDLNVALKSAQITYGADNETILGTAATSELGATPTLVTPTDIDTGLKW